jgi:hypothetical protein
MSRETYFLVVIASWSFLDVTAGRPAAAAASVCAAHERTKQAWNFIFVLFELIGLNGASRGATQIWVPTNSYTAFPTRRILGVHKDTTFCRPTLIGGISGSLRCCVQNRRSQVGRSSTPRAEVYTFRNGVSFPWLSRCHHDSW